MLYTMKYIIHINIKQYRTCLIAHNEKLLFGSIRNVVVICVREETLKHILHHG